MFWNTRAVVVAPGTAVRARPPVTRATPVLAIASMDERLFPGREMAVPNRDRRRSVLAPTWPWLL